MELPGTVKEIKELFGRTCYVFDTHGPGTIITGKITGVRIGDTEPLFDISYLHGCAQKVAARIFLTEGEAIDAHNSWLRSKHIKPNGEKNDK